MKIEPEFFKKVLIVFWFIWWSTAFLTDILGGLSHLGMLKLNWISDANYVFLKDSLSIYSPPNWVSFFFFILIIFGSMLSTLLFLWTVVGINKKKDIWMHRANIAYIFSLVFWLAFFIADQCIMKFDLEENHMVQGGFQLLSYLALYILP
jgi:hypothetical protein